MYVMHICGFSSYHGLSWKAVNNIILFDAVTFFMLLCVGVYFFSSSFHLSSCISSFLSGWDGGVGNLVLRRSSMLLMLSIKSNSFAFLYDKTALSFARYNFPVLP